MLCGISARSWRTRHVTLASSVRLSLGNAKLPSRSGLGSEPGETILLSLECRRDDYRRGVLAVDVCRMARECHRKHPWRGRSEHYDSHAARTDRGIGAQECGTRRRADAAYGGNRSAQDHGRQLAKKI